METEYKEIERLLTDAQKHGRWLVDKNYDSFTACTFSWLEAKDFFERLKNLQENLIPNQF